LVTAIYIVQVTITDRTSDAMRDAAITDHVAPPASRATLLREISVGVATLASRRRCAAARRVHRSGISLGHLQVLWILQEHGPLPVSRLADWLGIGVPNVTGLLDRMEQRGLVERRHDLDDRRVVVVHPAAGGAKVFQDMNEHRRAALGRLLTRLSDDELSGLLNGHRALRAARAAVVGQRDATDSKPATEAPGP
jgi:DNA-binding MarR family transcriptional regulator